MLTVASMRVPNTKRAVLELAKRYNDIAAKLKNDGMRVG
jgi:hypothetical protein